MGRPAVDPDGYALAVELDVAVLVYGHARGLFNQVKGIRSLCECALGDIHDYLVHFHLHQIHLFGDLGGLEHFAVILESDFLQFSDGGAEYHLQTEVTVTYHRSHKGVAACIGLEDISSFHIGGGASYNSAVLGHKRHRRESEGLSLHIEYLSFCLYPFLTGG